MPYKVIFLDSFTAWLNAQSEELQDRSIAHITLLKERGPLLGRPYADTLKGSEITNLKELRFAFERAPIRILFAFDPKPQAIIILGGNKATDKRWYQTNIPIAEKLYREHLEKQKKSDEETASPENNQ
jgi:hypothetical protein